MSKNDNYCVGCTTCCQWGGKIENHITLEKGIDAVKKFEVEESNPLKLRAQANGDCVYLNRGKGCMIHDKRPVNCITFDCRTLLDDVLRDPANVFIRVLMEATRIKMVDIIKSTKKKKKKKKKPKVFYLP